MDEPIFTIIGSINMDLITVTETVPEQGETVLGSEFQTKPGGKGANQAVAAARLGAKVQMVGKVGEDKFGLEMDEVLKKEGIDTEMVEIIPGVNTGIASITISDSDNRIIVVPGANHVVDSAYLEQFKAKILRSDKKSMRCL